MARPVPGLPDEGMGNDACGRGHRMNNTGGNNPTGGKTWPPARIEALRKLWATGKSAQTIATELGGGLTRNAVIGAARRAGCPRRPSPIKLSDEQRTKRKHYR